MFGKYFYLILVLAATQPALGAQEKKLEVEQYVPQLLEDEGSAMKLRKFKQNKLWRDKAIEMLEQRGSKIHWTALNDAEFMEQLKIKFMEEAQEVCQAKTKEALVEELADILEVISSMCDVHGFTLQDIMAVQSKKRQERGGFNGRKFVTVAEHQLDSFGEKYCLADPEKYPEIID